MKWLIIILSVFSLLCHKEESDSSTETYNIVLQNDAITDASLKFNGVSKTAHKKTTIKVTEVEGGTYDWSLTIKNTDAIRGRGGSGELTVYTDKTCRVYGEYTGEYPITYVVYYEWR